jgi:hypothetical protein
MPHSAMARLKPYSKKAIAYQKTIDAFIKAGGDPAIYDSHPWRERKVPEGILRRNEEQIRHDRQLISQRL